MESIVNVSKFREWLDRLSVTRNAQHAMTMRGISQADVLKLLQDPANPVNRDTKSGNLVVHGGGMRVVVREQPPGKVVVLTVFPSDAASDLRQ